VQIEIGFAEALYKQTLRALALQRGADSSCTKRPLPVHTGSGYTCHPWSPPAL